MIQSAPLIVHVKEQVRTSLNSAVCQKTTAQLKKNKKTKTSSNRNMLPSSAIAVTHLCLTSKVKLNMSVSALLPVLRLYTDKLG